MEGEVQEYHWAWGDIVIGWENFLGAFPGIRGITAGFQEM